MTQYYQFHKKLTRIMKVLDVLLHARKVSFKSVKYGFHFYFEIFLSGCHLEKTRKRPIKEFEENLAKPHLDVECNSKTDL